MGIKFNHIILHIMGFTQTLNRYSGIHAAWAKTRKMVKPSPDTMVMTPLQWKANWDHYAEFIRWSSHSRTRIYVMAYSWGAGWGFMNLAKKLNDGLMTRRITYAMLIDPVFRSPLLPSWLPINPLSMTSFFNIDIERNVDEVKYYLQRQNRPQGRILRGSPATEIHNPTYLELNHEDMEDAEIIHDAFIKDVCRIRADARDNEWLYRSGDTSC